MFTLTAIFFLSICTALAFVITFSRLRGFRFLVKHATIVDVVFTVTLVIVMSGTATGMLIAIMAGLVLSCILSFFRAVFKGIDKAKQELRNQNGEYDNKGEWVYNKAPYV